MHGCMGVHVHVCIAVHVTVCMVVHLYVCMVVHLYVCMAVHLLPIWLLPFITACTKNGGLHPVVNGQSQGERREVNKKR